MQRRHQACPVFCAKHDVLQNRKILDEFEVLEDHPDAGGDGSLAVGDLCFFSVDEYLAGIGLVEPV